MKIKSAKFLTSAPDLQSCPEPGLPEIAFIGRSNVGKSSLINMLANRANLAKVSATPGATRLLNFFTMNESWYLVDLPGYGYSKVKQANREQFHQAVSDYLSQRVSLRCICLLIDSRLPPQKIDLEFCDWLVSGEIPFVLVFTKADKLKASKLKSNVATFLQQLEEMIPNEPPHFITSSKDRSGQRELLGFVEEVVNG
ncbi:YihA family ribosome biogenesis GTP-binding protein [Luteolibacter pohnpeiensis]|uniref:Probable GTP-binding protein EngB n=1 Tax=Luteolibacter pohnpeiensis TaxID=454153 RepID=A0A934S6T1_9BACT|nr:ribosome biogenesis GTP-binding protein YihA/YsxC [Luteolibacter pohnpeiensis]MBK1882239.1 YihA family ribosome biogenesis GTP-binding protein [Luteolibacter pohnpeiensis]